MTIGERIKKRRVELNLTQMDLARMMGYKSKTSICHVETDAEQNLTLDRVELFAKALRVTPSYLMGWTDEGDDYIDGVTSHMSQDESYADAGKKDAEILIKIHALNANNYNLLLNMLNTMLESQQQ